MNNIPVKKIMTIISLIALLGFGSCFVGNMFETVGAGQIVVKQGLADGKLTVWNTPGLEWQGWGKLTYYKRSDQFSFTGTEGADPAVKVRFNDFGHADATGSLRYDLPTEPELVKRLHSTYGSQQAVERQLIAQAVRNAIYMTGPLMSSTDSASARRADLLSLAEDQLRFGVYRQKTKAEKIKDAITGSEKTVTVVELIPCTNSQSNPLCISGFERQDRSPLDEFGIKSYNLTYANITYETKVEQQIHAQQEAKAAVETAIAHSKKAEQDALTATKQGEAQVAAAKASQDVETAKAVGAAQRQKETTIIAAQQELEKAKLLAQAAEQDKKATTLKAEGEATAARLKQQASNFQQEKIDAWLEAQKVWAESLKGAQLTPQFVMGGGSPQGLDFMKLITAKTALDLGVSLQTQHAK